MPYNSSMSLAAYNTTHMDCAKCKVKRRVYITDEDPATLTKYKTCDACRRKNKVYKKNQKLKMLHKLNAMDQLQRESVMGPTIQVEQDLGHVKPVKLRPSFTSFLERVSHNKQRDVISIKYSCEVPEFIIQRYDSSMIISNRPDYASVDSVEQKVINYREEVKKKLKLHYLSRLFDILESQGYTFKTRSTNWKNNKFYAQMLCHEDVGNKRRDFSLLVDDADVPENSQEQDINESHDNENAKYDVAQPRNVLLYPCQSRLNYSFDSTSGLLSLEYSHLDHDGLPPTNPQDPKSIAHPPNSAINLASQWVKQLQSTPNGEQTDNASRMKLLMNPEQDGSDASSQKNGSALANALNYLHRNISNKE
ncbi:hypothetical protein KL909_002135 [Ogataea angusta]|nr:hypothetical protein KL909_002135 [Ogataea angusta]KAG7860541.1 hypothetical protein KL939_002027 [Ogataea angusta]